MKQERILIYLHPKGVRDSLVAFDVSNQIIRSGTNVDLTQLSDIKDGEVYVIVPMEDVLLAQVALPKLSRQRMLQALPFALEDQLIDDVEELHFAIGEYQADGTLPVAIVSRQKMTAWLNTFLEQGIAPRAFIPAIFALPYIASHWQINTYEDHCLIRTGQFSGFACEQENLETLLELKLAEEPQRESLNLIRTHLSEQQLLENMADITNLKYINLLQGTYQAKPQSTKIKKIWLLAGCLAAACLVLGFFDNLVAFFMLHNQHNKIETEINQIYQRNFPQAKAIVAPRARMEEKIRKLTGQAHQNNFLGLLGELGKSLSAAPVRIQHMEFREQQLVLDVTASSFDNLDNFTRSLAQQGLSVKQQNAAAAGEQVKATLMIRAGAA
ncbi:MAG: type II secretion system protein GspL [Gammaproteobacteria bacterium]